MDAARIREATPGDAKEIDELCHQLGYATDVQGVTSRLERLLPHPDHAVFVAQAGGGALVGWIQISLSLLVESPVSAEVGGLVVRDGARGHGVGPLLLAEAEAWSRAKGCARMRVPCNVVRADAHRFYEREGFREVKKQRIFERAIG